MHIAQDINLVGYLANSKYRIMVFLNEKCLRKNFMFTLPYIRLQLNPVSGRISVNGQILYWAGYLATIKSGIGPISVNGQIWYWAGYPATVKSCIGPDIWQRSNLVSGRISVNDQIWYWAGYPASLKSGIWPDTKYHKRLGYLVHPYNTVVRTKYCFQMW